MVINEEFWLCRGRVGGELRGTRPVQLAQHFGAEVGNFLELERNCFPPTGRSCLVKPGGSVNRNDCEMMV